MARGREIMDAVPGSRLLVFNVVSREFADWVSGYFAERGVGSDRLTVTPKMNFPDYLAAHSQVDLALDSYPFNGGTVTHLALWMGAYVAKATELASDPRRMAELRRGLRDMVRASPFTDYEGYAASLERAFREMWLDCVQGGGS